MANVNKSFIGRNVRIALNQEVQMAADIMLTSGDRSEHQTSRRRHPHASCSSVFTNSKLPNTMLSL